MIVSAEVTRLRDSLDEDPPDSMVSLLSRDAGTGCSRTTSFPFPLLGFPPSELSSLEKGGVGKSAGAMLCLFFSFLVTLCSSAAFEDPTSLLSRSSFTKPLRTSVKAEGDPITMEALLKAIFVGLGVRECEGGVGGKSRSLEVVGALSSRSRSFLAAAISYVPNSAERRRERRLTEARIGSLCAEGGADVGLGVRAADRNDGEDCSAECLD